MNGINRFARTIQERMQAMNIKPSVLDFGTIQGDMSLLTNGFPLPIPQSDYLVCRSAALGKADDIIIKTKVAAAHTHDVPVGEKRRWLQPGDRVLVAWVGDDACVVDLILPASTIK